jgi:type III secretory pathway component EscT
VEPLAELDVNEPGLILMLVAPVVTQLNVLLAPGAMLVGLAVKEVIVGTETGISVSVRVLVADPALFVAVKV